MVGGANSAGQAAVHFSRFADRVHMLVRGGDLRRSMSSYLIDQIEAIDNIVLHPWTEVVDGKGDGHLQQLTLRDTRSGATDTVSTSWLFVFIGAEPRTEWLDGVVVRDELGFVVTGPDLLAAWTAAGRLDAAQGSVPPGVQHSRGLRRR